MKIKITDKSGVVLFSNLIEKCEQCLANEFDTISIVKICNPAHEYRNVKFKTKEYELFFCGDQTEFKNNKMLREKAEILRHSAKTLLTVRDVISNGIYAEAKRNYDTVVHNIKSLNTQNSQLVYNYAPLLFVNSKDHFPSIIKEAVEATNSNETAKVLFQIMKNSEHISNEFVAHDTLFLKDSQLQKMKHPLHRLIFNVYQTFDLEFRHNSIKLNLVDFSKKLFIDYNTFRLALHHIFMNAAKYMKPKSILKITFSEVAGKFTIEFDMLSLQIEENEIEKIFDDGYSGKYPHLCNKNGAGLGMGMIKKALELNDGELSINAGKEVERVKKVPYARNKFFIRFPLSLVS